MNLLLKYEVITLLEYKTLDNYKGYLVQVKLRKKENERSTGYKKNKRKG